VDVNVLLPTPPLPDKTMILCLTDANLHFTSFTPEITKIITDLIKENRISEASVC